MTTYMPAFFALALLAAILLHLAGKRRPRLATALAVLLAGVAYLAATEPLSHPKPVRIEMLAELDGAEVQWFAASPGDGIDVLLAGPRLYSFPWSEQLARALHEAGRQAEAAGGTVRLHMGDGAEGGQPSAGWEPLPAGPPKE